MTFQYVQQDDEATLTELYSDEEPDVDLSVPSWIAETRSFAKQSMWSSLDGGYTAASGSGTVSLNKAFVELSTGTTSGSVVEVDDNVWTSRSYYNSSYEVPHSYSSSFRIDSTLTDARCHVGMGSPFGTGNAGHGIEYDDSVGELRFYAGDDTTVQYETITTTPSASRDYPFLQIWDGSSLECWEFRTGTRVTFDNPPLSGGWTELGRCRAENLGATDVVLQNGGWAFGQRRSFDR